MATLGKAAGVSGAFVAAEPEAVEMLIQRARPYIYTTAAPPMLSVALMKSLELMHKGESKRRHLQALIARLRQQLKPGRWRLMPSQTAIQPLVIGSNDETVAVSEALAHDGLLIPAIRPPTVPQGTARLRISLSAAHSMEDIERLAAALNALQ
ncbi:8-amino-7-oxononanoate synthase [compost metagenome]